MLITHPKVEEDLENAVRFLDSKSNIVGDKFLQAIESAGEQIKENPLRFHPYGDRFRRCNLHGFPYHMIYEVDGKWIGILVIRHNRRHARFGLDRTWP